MVGGEYCCGGVRASVDLGYPVSSSPELDFGQAKETGDRNRSQRLQTV